MNAIIFTVTKLFGYNTMLCSDELINLKAQWIVASVYVAHLRSGHQVLGIVSAF